MKPKCCFDDCRSENLDQGINDVLLCHDCNRYQIIIPTYQNVNLTNDT